jgi:hypothetical protein
MSPYRILLAIPQYFAHEPAAPPLVDLFMNIASCFQPLLLPPLLAGNVLITSLNLCTLSCKHVSSGQSPVAPHLHQLHPNILCFLHTT